MKSDAENSDTEKICNRCGKPKSQGTGGSITQWISGCKCAELSELQQTVAKTCATCGKSIQAGRPGSLTQWVFRQDICACQVGGAGFPVEFEGSPHSSQNFEGNLIPPVGQSTMTSKSQSTRISSLFKDTVL